MSPPKLRPVPSGDTCAEAESAEPQSVFDRIQNRVRVLEEWVKKGIPQDQLGCLPPSLRQARVWNAPKYGIVPIRSPNAFTTTHAEWGKAVEKVGTLLDELHFRYRPAQKKKPATTVAAEARTKSSELALVLRQVTSQWHAADQVAKDAAEELAHKDGLIADLTGQVEAKNTELASLRRELSALKAAPRLRRT